MEVSFPGIVTTYHKAARGRLLLGRISGRPVLLTKAFTTADGGDEWMVAIATLAGERLEAPNVVRGRFDDPMVDLTESYRVVPSRDVADMVWDPPPEQHPGMIFIADQASFLGIEKPEAVGTVLSYLDLGSGRIHSDFPRSVVAARRWSISALLDDRTWHRLYEHGPAPA